MSTAPAVALTENGNAFTATGVTIPLTLTGTGTLTGGSATTSAGVATYSNPKVSAAGSGDTLTATLSLNPNLSTPLSLTVVSSLFDVASAVTASQQIAQAFLTESFRGLALYRGNGLGRRGHTGLQYLAGITRGIEF